MILERQNALQQRNEQIEKELDEMEKELKEKEPVLVLNVHQNESPLLV
jgi:sugar-specific transcriptional regulator TrmB